MIIPNGVTLIIKNQKNVTRTLGNVILSPKEKEPIHFQTTAELRQALRLQADKEIRIQTKIPQSVLSLLDIPEELLPQEEPVERGGVVFRDELKAALDEVMKNGAGKDLKHEAGTYQIEGEETYVYRIKQLDENGNPYTLLEVSAPELGEGEDTEATMTLMRKQDGESGGVEFIDFFNNGYSDSRLMGVRIQSRGSGVLRPFVFEFNRGNGVTETMRVNADGTVQMNGHLHLRSDDDQLVEFQDGDGTRAGYWGRLVSNAARKMFRLLNQKGGNSIELHDNGSIVTYSPTGDYYVYLDEGAMHVNDQKVQTQGLTSLVSPDGSTWVAQIDDAGVVKWVKG